MMSRKHIICRHSMYTHMSTHCVRGIWVTCCNANRIRLNNHVPGGAQRHDELRRTRNYHIHTVTMVTGSHPGARYIQRTAVTVMCAHKYVRKVF